MKRLLFVTGQPGVGKTTLLLHVVDNLKTKGYKVGGMTSSEVREQGTRIGFEIVNLQTGQKGWLAHIRQRVGPQVGKYRVNLDDLKNIGADSILNAIENADITVVDEIGPMELFSQAFKDAIQRAVDSGKPLLGTIHFRAQDPLMNAIRKRDDVEIIEVTVENRGSINSLITAKILKILQNSIGK